MPQTSVDGNEILVKNEETNEKLFDKDLPDSGINTVVGSEASLWK